MYKVILVDDEAMITKGLQALLDWEDHGFEIIYTAESGEAALAFLQEHQADILITDILMGDMSGLELISEVKKIQPAIKSIVLTGYQQFDYVKQGLLLGIENYLVKPVDEDELLTTVQNVGAKLKATSVHQGGERSTLMDNAIWRFLNGELEKHDFRERMALYQFPLTHPLYNVSILNLEHDQEIGITAGIKEYIELQFSATCIFSPHQEMVIIFGGKDEEALHKDHHLLVRYLKENNARTGLFYLSMGKPVPSVDRLEESFNCAREYSLSQIQSEPNGLITEEMATHKQEEIKRLQEFKDQTVKRLMKTDEEALELIDLFFEELRKVSPYISLSVAKKYTFDFISYIHYSLQMDDLSYYTAAIEKMVYSKDMSQIKTIFREYLKELMLAIHHHVQMRSPIVQNVLNYVHAHYNEGISLKVLSQQFHVNTIYLGQLFQKEVGVVFSEYLNRYRLEKAKELLKTTHYRAGEIGKKVGYSDTAYFYKQFKKSVGTTPSEWRNL